MNDFLWFIFGYCLGRSYDNGEEYDERDLYYERLYENRKRIEREQRKKMLSYKFGRLCGKIKLFFKGKK